MKIILASASPRRTEILSLANITHIVIPSTCEEIVEEGLSPYEVVESLSYQKAYDVAKDHPYDLVIGSDTIVTINGEILGKPKDEQDAIRMLEKLSNATHEVVTGVTVIHKDKVKTFHEVTFVTFSKMTDSDIREYISREHVYDKAGSYAIQGAACKYITKIDGDYYNVVGLPIARLYKEIEVYLNEIQ